MTAISLDAFPLLLECKPNFCGRHSSTTAIPKPHTATCLEELRIGEYAKDRQRKESLHRFPQYSILLEV
jgi:hypothetical protein